MISQTHFVVDLAGDLAGVLGARGETLMSMAPPSSETSTLRYAKKYERRDLLYVKRDLLYVEKDLLILAYLNFERSTCNSASSAIRHDSLLRT